MSTLAIILLVLLVVFLIGPGFVPHTYGYWGWLPAFILLILLILALTGRL